MIKTVYDDFVNRRNTCHCIYFDNIPEPDSHSAIQLKPPQLKKKFKGHLFSSSEIKFYLVQNSFEFSFCFLFYRKKFLVQMWERIRNKPYIRIYFIFPRRNRSYRCGIWSKQNVQNRKRIQQYTGLFKFMFFFCFLFSSIFWVALIVLADASSSLLVMVMTYILCL